MKSENFYEKYDKKENLKFDSQVVHGALGHDPNSGAVSFPIFQSVTFAHRTFGLSTGYDYSRVSNPTREELERTMAVLEEGECGFAFSSGQAATMATMNMLRPGDHCVLGDDLYGGTRRTMDMNFSQNGVEASFVDVTDLNAVADAVRSNTKMIFVETPTNPTMQVCDIRAISEIAKKAGAVLVVDNTFMTPYFQKPLKLGADIVVHSATKYLAGHNDVLAGIAVIKDKKYFEHFDMQMKVLGACLAPLDSWLTLRGIQTLALRMKKHNENAKIVAEWLRKQPKVKKVYYVGFEDWPGYEINLKQASGFSGMISFELESEECAHKLLSNVKMIMFAESLGGTQSLVTYPMTQTHAEVPEDERNRLGINAAFVRLSVGIEDPQDIINDLEQALK